MRNYALLFGVIGLLGWAEVGVGQNLVPNPSFEEYEICPETIGFQPGGKPLHWDKWQWSPEYFNACAGELNDVDTVLDVPLNGFGFQYAYDGEGYVGMATFQDDFREYVGCELVSPLIAGNTYRVSLMANVATGGNYWNPKLASNNLGVLFTMSANVWTGLSGPSFEFRNYAHLHSQEVLSDTVAWEEISGAFIADSAYRYMVVGNFFEDALTDTLGLEGFSSYAAYYFVDAVCVTTMNEACDLGAAVENRTNRRVHVWPNPVGDVLHITDLAGTFRVVDPAGRAIVEGISSGYTRIDLGVADWAPGYYLLVSNDGLLVRSFVVLH